MEEDGFGLMMMFRSTSCHAWMVSNCTEQNIMYWRTLVIGSIEETADSVDSRTVDRSNSRYNCNV